MIGNILATIWLAA